MTWRPRNWRDILAPLIVVGLPVFWAYLLSQNWQGSEVVIGTTLGGWTLVVQFFYRKKDTESDGPPESVPHG